MVLERREGQIPSLFPKKHSWIFFLAGFFFAIDLSLWNWSIDYTTIVNSALFNNSAAFFVPLIMWAWMSQKPTVNYIVAAALGFLGCVLLAGQSFFVDFSNVLGDFAALCSGMLVALYLISLKSIREETSTGFIMFWTGLVSLFFLGFLAYLFGESFSPLTIRDVISIFGQAILVHALGQSLLAYSLAKIPASYTAIILFLSPMTGALLGWLMYDEALNMIKITGMLLIMISIVAARSRA